MNIELMLYVAFLFTVLGFCCGYCFGKADGIKWTRELYKSQNEEFEQLLKEYKESQE